MPQSMPFDPELLRALEVKGSRLYWTKGRRVGKPVGCPDQDGYIVFAFKRRQYKEHRVLFFLYYGHLPDQVDHINGDTSDNRKENLRACDNVTNQWNRADIRGYREKNGRFEARISYKGKRVALGSYGCPTAARLAYLRAVKDLHKGWGRVRYSEKDVPKNNGVNAV